jgi:acetyl-CoA C-acetyltransferase
MPDAYIFDALRTPRGRGRADGSLHDITALSLASQCLKALAERSALDTRSIDDVVLGCVAPVGEQGSNIARIAALTAGYAESVAGVQVNRFCGSGLEACNIAASKVIGNEADLVVAGGVESMSRVPMGSDGGTLGVDPSFAYEHYFTPQGIGADLIATLDGFSRRDVDDYAVHSQRRAAAAWDAGRFQKSILPVRDQVGLIRLSRDELVRPDTTLESLASLKAAFAQAGEACFDDVARQRYPQVDRVSHVHHAGNSSGIVDGAAAVLIGSKAAGESHGLRPRARIRAMASIGSEPTIMLTGPALATDKVLRRASMSPGDVDLFELNEAFASVVLHYMRVLDIPHERINVNGGAIAMGHPLGATGAMILGTLLDELERRDLECGLVTLCEGAGMATATVIERV